MILPISQLVKPLNTPSLKTIHVSTFMSNNFKEQLPMGVLFGDYGF